MAQKKYISLDRLSNFLDNLREVFSSLSHKHTLLDITDYKIDAELSSTSSNPVQNKVLDAEFEAISQALNVYEQVLDDKADKTHSHDDLYYTEEEIDNKLVNFASTTIVDNKIGTHNASNSAHNDIRVIIEDLTNKLNNFLDVDDATSDQLSEVLTLIENNKGTLESLTTSKVNVSDIIDNLTTNISTKVLSAAQGVIIKNLIDDLQIALDNLESVVDNKAEVSHNHQVSDISDLSVTANELNHMSGVTNNIQFQLDTLTSAIETKAGYVTDTVTINGITWTRTIWADGRYEAYCTITPSTTASSFTATFPNIVIDPFVRYSVLEGGLSFAINCSTTENSFIMSYDKGTIKRINVYVIGSIEIELDLEGDGQIYNPLTSTTLTFKSPAPISKFQEVRLNGETVDPSNYDLIEGSTIVVFHSDFLATLKADAYEVTIVSTNIISSGNFTVEKAETPDEPETPTAPEYNGYIPKGEYTIARIAAEDDYEKGVTVICKSDGWVTVNGRECHSIYFFDCFAEDDEDMEYFGVGAVLTVTRDVEATEEEFNGFMYYSGLRDTISDFNGYIPLGEYTHIRGDVWSDDNFFSVMEDEEGNPFADWFTISGKGYFGMDIHEYASDMYYDQSNYRSDIIENGTVIEVTREIKVTKEKYNAFMRNFTKIS